MRQVTAHAIIIGSGPSGISCAWSLLRAGWKVTMLDVGINLDGEQAGKLRILQAADSTKWNAIPESAFLREGIGADAKGIPLKLAYGSDFPYRTVPGATQVACDGAHTQASLARGGFSNVWGSAMLPWRQHDLARWPVTESDLVPHYRAVLHYVPLAGIEDDLAGLFPLYRRPTPLPLSAQAKNLLARMSEKRAALAARKILAGASRLAVSNAAESRCRLCGLCMYGCPAGLIYCSTSSLERLTANPNFTYRPGAYVTHVGERDGAAFASGFETDTRSPFAISAERVFLASGAVGSSAILLRSLGAYGQPVTMRDSQYFLQPCLTVNGVQNVRKENLHTLAQAFIEILDEAVSRYTVHFQLYTYNELYSRAIAAAAGPFERLAPKDFLLSRLVLLQGYLHSDESRSMNCVLEKTQPADILHIHVNDNPVTLPTIRKATRKLLRSSAISGLVPLLPLLRPGQPGRGFHSGGTFPMQDSPSGFASDRLGRPAGFLRIHAVDATVCPSIPATTITLTAMANAHRIGALAAEL